MRPFARLLSATALAACFFGSAAALRAEDDGTYRNYGQPDLFYNYYVNPSHGGMGAAMYLSPRPVPAYVGHTYITYQPLMPHEFLYRHHHKYHRYYNDGRGLTRTSVKYW